MADENDNKPNPAETFQKLLVKYDGDGVKLASQLFDENFQLREKNRTLVESQPKEGSVILSADDAKSYNSFKQFLSESKLDFKQAKEIITKFPEVEKSNKELSQMETLREVADIGLEGSKLKLSVLKDQLQKFPDAAITFKDEKDKDGNVAKVAYIKPNAEGAESSFSEFATQNLADYLPALKVSQEAQPPKKGNGFDPQPSGAKTGIFDRIREKVKSEDKKPVTDIDARFGRSANA